MKTRIKVFTVWLISFFLLSSFYLVQPINPIQQTNEILQRPNHNLADPVYSAPIDQKTKLIESPITPQAVELGSKVAQPSLEEIQNQWFVGESVFVNHTFPEVHPIHYDTSYYAPTMDLEITTSGISNIYNSDGYHFQGYLRNILTTGTDDPILYINWIFENLGNRPFTITYEISAGARTQDGTLMNLADSVYTISSSDVDAFVFGAQCIYNYYNIASAGLAIYVQEGLGGPYTLKTSTTSTPTDAVLDYVSCKLDEIYLQFDPVEENIRSEYKYSSNSQILHKLEIQSFVSSEQIELSIPENWIYSSINPSVTVTKPSNNYIVDTEYPSIYDVFFLSNTTNIVALNDVSSDYMQCVGFECGKYQDDWTNGLETGTNPFDFLTVDTSIVYEGSFSLKMDDSNVKGTLDFPYQNLDDGDYYLSFSYYVEIAPTDYFQLVYYDGVAKTIHFDVGITNRWIQYFGFIHLAGFYDSDDDWKFHFKTNTVSQMVIYFDNFRFWKPSGQQTNLGLSEYEFSSQFIYWDGYKDPATTNLEVQWSLRDRTTDTEIISKTLTTNEFGIASYNFQGALEMKEYESRWWSWDSSWGTTSQDYTESTTDWVCFDPTCVIALDSDDKLSGQYSITFSLSSPGSNAVFDPYVNGVTENIENWDYYVGWQKATVALDFRTDNYVYWIANYPLHNGFDETDSLFTLGAAISTNWEFFAFDRNIYSRLDSGLDFTDVDRIYPAELEYITSTVVTYYVDDLRFIQAQKSYFTPIPSSYSPLAYEIKQDKSRNYWDFSEGVTEFDSAIALSVQSVSRGQITYTATSSSVTKIQGEFNGVSIDTDYYTHASMRISANVSDLQVNFYTQNNGFPLGDWQVVPQTSYAYLVWDLSLDSDWTGTFTSLSVRIDEIGGDGQPENTDLIYLDGVFLYHMDTDHYRGYNWEFEEPNYLDGWEAENSATLEQHQDYLLLTNTGSDDYSKATIYLEQAIGTSQVSRIEALVSSSGSSDVVLRTELTGSFVEYGSPLPTTITTKPEIISLMVTSTFDEIMIQEYVESGSDDIYVYWVRFYIENADNGLQETDAMFYFQSENNSLIYYFESDGFQGIIKDNELILKNNTLGSHILVYSAIASIDPKESRYDFLQLASTWYYYTYSVIQTDPEFIIEDISSSIDASAGLVYFDFFSNWGNTTIRIKDNSTYLGSAVSEGATVWSFSPIPGFHNFTAEIKNGATLLWEIVFSITIAQPEVEAGLDILYTDFSYDAAAGKIYFSWFTNWENTTASIYDNSTLLGSGPEQSISVDFIANYGLHNITIYLNNSNIIMATFYTSFTIARSQGIYEVYIDIYDGIGLGINFEKVVVYATIGSNIERIGKSFFWPNNTITLTIKDYFGVNLASGSYNLTSGQINYIGIQVSMYELTITNPYEVGVAINILRATNTMNVIVPANASFTLTLSTGTYLLSLKPVYDHPNFTDGIIGNEPIIQYAPVQDSYSHSTISNYQIRLENRFTPESNEPGFFEKARRSSMVQFILFFGSVATLSWWVYQRWKKRDMI